MTGRLICGLVAITAGWGAYELNWTPERPAQAAVERIAPPPPSAAMGWPELAEYQHPGAPAVQPGQAAAVGNTRRDTQARFPQETAEQQHPTQRHHLPRREPAALLEEESRLSQRLKVGESIAGWRLEKIEEGAVTLKSGSRSQQLELRIPPRPPVRPTRKPAQALPVANRPVKKKITGNPAPTPPQWELP